MLSPCPRCSGALWVLSWLLKTPFFIPPAAPAPSLGLCLHHGTISIARSFQQV